MYSNKAFYPKIDYTPVNVAVGVVSSAATALNRSSHLSALRVVNAGANTTWILFGGSGVGPATSANGIRMLPNSVEVFNLDPLSVTHFTCIGDVAGNTLHIVEGDGV
jgi:hypothetical protein